uniref:Reverse transcriptase domain-containing protein n=1 Tax=Tanacetum cinerariifolium TaxID=118510 RepID=A0A6L2N339_TANCI|nr:reverse transcriptase domain-containing protein [Tanacetum cinerariifolium]
MQNRISKGQAHDDVPAITFMYTSDGIVYLKYHVCGAGCGPGVTQNMVSKAHILGDVAAIRLLCRLHARVYAKHDWDGACNLKMLGNEDHHRQGRRFAAGGNGHDGRDPRDVEIERFVNGIADRGNEEDGPDSRARGDRFYHNRRSADRGNEKVDCDPWNISEIKGLRRRVRDLEIQHEIRQIWKRIRELKLQQELTKETESEPIIWDIEDEEEEYPFVNKYPSLQEPSMLVEE